MSRPAEPAGAPVRAFFKDAAAEHAATLAAVGVVERRLLFADRLIALRFAGSELADGLLGAVRARLADSALPLDRPVDATIGLWEERLVPGGPRPVPWSDDDVGPRGLVRGDGAERILAVHEAGSLAVTLVDRESASLLHRVPDRARLPWWERAAPLRPALFFALTGPGRHLVHAGVVGDERGGILLAGAGGSGKTTVALAALAGGMSYVGDDYVLLQSGPEPVAFNLFGTAKLDAGHVSRFGELARGSGMAGDVAAGEKAVLDVEAALPGALAQRLAIRALVVPRIRGGHAQLRQASAGEALLALAPSTAFQMPFDEGRVLGSLAALVRAVPAFALDVGDHPAELVEALDRVLDTSGSARASRTVAGLVSVIVPAYEAEEFLAEALESALAQDHPSMEVIVVDDGSSDGTADVARAYPVTLVQRANGGPAAARNSGLERARGEFVTILDADDVWPADRLSSQLEHLCEHPEHGLVLGLTEVFITPGQRPPEHDPGFGPGDRVAGHPATMLARREVFGLVGPFDETLRLSEDVDWLARAADAGVQAGRLDRTLLRYRIHAGNTSARHQANHAATLGVLRASVARKREAGGARAR